MRDMQRLEQLSSTAAVGMWADDVVIALDRAASQGRGVRRTDKELLESAATTLDEARERVDRPLLAPRSTQSLAATDTTLTAVEVLAGKQTADARDLLRKIATVLRKVVASELAASDAESLQMAITTFSLIAKQQLAESNSVLVSRKDMGSWTATEMTSAC